MGTPYTPSAVQCFRLLLVRDVESVVSTHSETMYKSSKHKKENLLTSLKTGDISWRPSNLLSL